MTKKDRRYEIYKPIYDEWIKLYPFSTENLDGEIWLPIPDYEELYHGSNFGRVKSFHKGKVTILKPSLHTSGYLNVTLCKNGKRKFFRLNVLVAQLFIPNPDNKPEVNHRYSRFSNHADCLEWATGSENVRHAVRTGLMKSGENRHNAKLTNEQIVYIRENPEHLSTYKLAEKFGVVPRTISAIQLGENWKQAGGNIRESKAQHVSDEKREKILAEYLAGGISKRALARRFGVDHKTVSNIVNGRR